MQNIMLKAPAKINLTLDIIGKRADGYHNIRSVMQSISIFDYVTLYAEGKKCAFPDIRITCTRPDIPTDERNIAYKVCKAFFKTVIELPFDSITIHIDKKIPSSAGLAGGSADGAAVLKGLNSLCGDILSYDELCKIGASAGADIPFCIVGGTALCEGIGEKVTHLNPLPDCEILVVKPDISISTTQSYKRFDKLKNPRFSDFDTFLAALEAGDLHLISRCLSNSLEDASDERIIADIKSVMLKSGALGAMMTGSGSAVFGIFDSKLKAKKCYLKFIRKMFCSICNPLKRFNSLPGMPVKHLSDVRTNYLQRF